MTRQRPSNIHTVSLNGIGPSGQEAIAFLKALGLDHPALQSQALSLKAAVTSGLTAHAGLVLVVGDFETRAELEQAKAVAALGRENGSLVVALDTQPAGQDLRQKPCDLEAWVDMILPVARHDFAATDSAGLPLDLPIAMAGMLLANPFCTDTNPDGLDGEAMVELLANSDRAAFAVGFGESVSEAAEAAWNQLRVDGDGAAGALIDVTTQAAPDTEIVAASHAFISGTPLATIAPWLTFSCLPHLAGGLVRVAILVTGVRGRETPTLSMPRPPATPRSASPRADDKPLPP